MGKKKEYKETNRMFLKRLASQEGVFAGFVSDRKSVV